MQIRQLVLRNKQTIISSGWSTRPGAGAATYLFICAMVGDNQDLDGMDHLPMEKLR